MASETIVAVFSNPSQAEAAISDLVASGVPSSSIKHYARDGEVGDTDMVATGDTTHHRHGFWAWLTGQENTTDEQHDIYDRSVQSGRTVVTVVSDGSNIDAIYSTLERHEPLDLDDHDATGAAGAGYAPGQGAGVTPVAALGQGAPGYATSGSPVIAPTTNVVSSTGATGTEPGLQSTAGAAGTEPGLRSTTDVAGTEPGLRSTATTQPEGTFASRTATDQDTTRTGNTEQVIPLSEETLQVGKREIDRGTTRIRRYTVERPVEEQIRLRDETVSVFRRPVTGSDTVGQDAFRDREVVMTESQEEAVVGKSARVVEEVVIQKGVTEHVETVRDTVRRDEVEIEGPAGRGIETTGKPGSTL